MFIFNIKRTGVLLLLFLFKHVNNFVVYVHFDVIMWVRLLFFIQDRGTVDCECTCMYVCIYIWASMCESGSVYANGHVYEFVGENTYVSVYAYQSV